MLDDISLFVRIVQSGGLAAAARRTGVPPATVTRRLARLEEQLDCRLLHRSARRLALTGEGLAYFARMEPLVERIERELEELDAGHSQMRGALTVTAPTNLSLKLLAPMWSGFATDYPEIRLDLRLANRLIDLEGEGVDLALRVGPQPDSSYHQKRIGLVRTVVLAAPGYVEARGMPERPDDLAEHRVIGIRARPRWRLEKQGGPQVEISPEHAIRLDDVGLAAQLACDGHGLVLLPVSEVTAELESGALLRVLEGWSGLDREIFAVWPTGRLLGARARACMDYIERFAAGVPCLQGEIPDQKA